MFRRVSVMQRLRAAAAVTATAATASIAVGPPAQAQIPAELRAESDVVVENWSSTHVANPVAYFSPADSVDVQHIIGLMHKAGERLRVVGSALSPNGLGLSDEAMLNVGALDQILSVDKEKLQVRVQAGARVSDVVEALRPHGLTLQNYASIAEQQIGGFVQVGAHGTGAAIPPVDEQVVAFTLHTPGAGRMRLSAADKSPWLFHLARVGLGWLGVVSEVTLQCVPAHKLLQHTFVETRAGVQRRHKEFLAHQHMRYMWIPYTDTVVVVTCDPVAADAPPPTPQPPTYSLRAQIQTFKTKIGLDGWGAVQSAERPLRELLLKRSEELGGAKRTWADVKDMSFAQLRDALLALAPLDKAHVVAINKAEAEFWKHSEGYRVDWSDKILGFECGGQQWVSEVAFPCGTRDAPDGRDLAYMGELLGMLEEAELPAPAPIEQRWTARSRSRLSPAYSPGERDLHSWVGIIMYLPTQEEEPRAAITAAFWGEYNRMCRERLWPKYGCHQHWAKIELPETAGQLEEMRARLRARYPLDEVWALKERLDPKGVLGNQLIDELLLPQAEKDRREAAAAAKKRKWGWFW